MIIMMIRRGKSEYLDVEVSLLVRALVDGHTLLGDDTDVAGLDDVTFLSLHNEYSVIEVVYSECSSAKGIHEGDLVVEVEVGSVPLEVWVILLLQYEDNVSWLYSRL